MVKARGGAVRCTECKKAWGSDGAELSEEEALALVPKTRAPRSKAKAGAKAGAKGVRATRARRTA